MLILAVPQVNMPDPAGPPVKTLSSVGQLTLFLGAMSALTLPLTLPQTPTPTPSAAFNPTLTTTARSLTLPLLFLPFTTLLVELPS